MIKKIVITDSGTLLTEEDISKVERRIDLVFPENFREFLKKYNGGYVDDENRDFIRYFIPLTGDEDEIIEYYIFLYSEAENLLSKEHVPIANSYSDNPLTLCLEKGTNYGKVFLFYFDRDQEPVIVANSLEELLGVESIADL